MGYKYRNPPLVEALCEFRFKANSPWPLTFHGYISEKLRAQFPVERSAQDIRFNAQVGPAGMAHQTQTRDKIMLFSEDEKSLVQIAPYLLAVNRLKPYLNWEHFLPLIRNAFDVYQSVAHPTGLEQVTLRFINRIEFEVGNVDVGDFLEFRPYVGPAFGDTMSAFAQVVEFAREEGRDLATVNLSTVDIGAPAMILNIDYALVQPGQIALNAVMDWIEQAHHHVENLFEACITDRLRAKLGVVT